MSRNEALVTLGFMGMIGMACLATHSADPLWFVFVLFIWLSL